MTYRQALRGRQRQAAVPVAGVILSLLLCLAKFGDNQQRWTLDSWDLPYAGCSNWCS